jgi:hypothetical protein
MFGMTEQEICSASRDNLVVMDQRFQEALEMRRLTGRALRANIDETVHLVVITEQGENRHLLEDQRNLFGFPYGFARRAT